MDGAAWIVFIVILQIFRTVKNADWVINLKILLLFFFRCFSFFQLHGSAVILKYVECHRITEPGGSSKGVLWD